MTPSELVSALDTRLHALCSTIRERITARTSTLVDEDPTDKTNAPGANTPGADTSGADTPAAGTDDVSTTEDADEPKSFPVISEETERTLNEVLVERGQTREEYICDVLAEHDGRLRQQRIMEYTGWSAASVSRLLGQMEDEETITRFRIGNEKIVCFPDADPRVELFETEIPVST